MESTKQVYFFYPAKDVHVWHQQWCWMVEQVRNEVRWRLRQEEILAPHVRTWGRSGSSQWG